MYSLTALDKPKRPTAVEDVGVPLLVTGFLASTGSYSVSVAQVVCAFLLCWMPWAAYRNWLKGDREKIPLFGLLAAVFWLSYSVPLFWAKHVVTGVFGRRVLTEDAITESLCLAIFGVVCLWLGMRAAAYIHWSPNVRKDVSNSPNRLNYLRAIFVFGTLVKAFVPITAFGPGARQIVSSFENIVPLVAFAIFFRYYLRGSILKFDKLLIYTYSMVSVVSGISSGWLGSVLGMGLLCTVVYISERRKLPVMAALIAFPVILFFQPAKSAFRDRYWRGESSDTATERATFWLENSWQLWNQALTSQDGEQFRELSDATLNRLSLLQQTAHVMELTPSNVPYQHGTMYSYIAVTFVPRFLWPDKPSVNDANRWYQVSYGLTDPHQLSTVSIAVGTVTESYINFGWFGPVLIIFPLGILLGSFERIFLHSDSSLLFSCVGAVLIPQLLAIESQMAEYIAGLAQQIILVLLVLIPTLEAQARQTESRRSGSFHRSPKSEILTSRPSISRQSAVRPKLP
jgi:hypothetical protein